ncbi:hypothetical protein AKJ09_02537 [Labilithrix luteola]|uniref:Tryptophan synthase alpha chain n=1 Tax=Labilithrix luteola TaxID=1391654 RepID=A0A0K1PQR6_9BACT|nr:hypothetical protein AKJ09_02537 [Labilithrix luteola]
MNRNTAWQACAFAMAALGLVTPSCATNLDLGQPSDNATPDAEPAPSFTSEDAGDASAVGDAAGAKLCIATTCPSTYATCEFDKYKCQTNLSSDSLHCGACDVQCPTYPQLKLTSRCVAGKCEFSCSPAGGSIKDCNGIVDDGCETDVATDRFNCGACGKVCPAGQNCHEGKCGCPPGKSECNGACVDLANDDFNCGACGAACDTSEDACGWSSSMRTSAVAMASAGTSSARTSRWRTATRTSGSPAPRMVARPSSVSTTPRIAGPVDTPARPTRPARTARASCPRQQCLRHVPRGSSSAATPASIRSAT